VPDGPVTAEEFRDALRSLGEKVHRRGLIADVYIFGGAAMVMAYNARPATRDIDAVFAPDTEVVEAAREVARERGWPASWLNNQASAYVSRMPDRGQQLVLEAPGIRCMAASPEHLLAMKVMAARRIQDAGDIRFLIERMGLRGVQDVIALVGEVFPDQPVSEHAVLLLQDIFDRLEGAS
jgi:methylmalonyl-CoA mutase cobalamin-binding subunit